jgi:DNA helicase HerA-like ATPase
MSRTPIENKADLRIGVVEFVAPNEIKVQLDIEAPDGVAANAGSPREFPRINSYVLVPNEGGYIVCQVEWIAIERSSFPKRKGYQDYGLIDLPFPIRKMRVAPLGILKMIENELYKFQRGVHSFPSIGSPVLIPTDLQLKSIVESGTNRRIFIGNSPLAANAQVKIDPDRLFGRHLAVLGNTGSGKSCTVAGLIQWSLEAIDSAIAPNARFIILDPNGEYSKVFGEDAKVYKVGDVNNKLDVPLWMWNSSEWSSFTQASARAQLPLLKRALRAMRNEELEFEDNPNIRAKKFIGILLQTLISSENRGEPYNGQFPTNKNFIEKLERWHLSLSSFDIDDQNLHELSELIGNGISIHKIPWRNGNGFDYPVFTSQEIQEFINKTRSTFILLGGDEKDIFPKNEDVPIPFNGNDFLNYLEALAQETGNEHFLEFLIARIRTMLADSRMDAVIGDEFNIELDKWLENYIGESDKKSIVIIDLSLVPAEIIHVTTSVIARIVFEALQRYRKINEKTLPTVLVIEEAHSFITRYSDNSESNSSSTCTKVFEKISREGRKFGLGLVLSSQRPSELSPTVLSQCNSFILHRISNDRDQELVGRLLPDNFRGLLKELPSLPTQKAVLLGWASELPILVKIRDLSKEKRPQSDDPDFWDVWNRKTDNGDDVIRTVDWKKIADDWQEKSEEE